MGLQGEWSEEPGKFRRLDHGAMQAIAQWMREIPPAPERLHSAYRAAGSVIDAGTFDLWLMDELQALQGFAVERVLSNATGSEAGETVDFEFECHALPEDSIAQVVLCLIPRGVGIGRILLACRVAKLPDGSLAVWPSGIPHAVDGCVASVN